MLAGPDVVVEVTLAERLLELEPLLLDCVELVEDTRLIDDGKLDKDENVDVGLLDDTTVVLGNALLTALELTNDDRLPDDDGLVEYIRLDDDDDDTAEVALLDDEVLALDEMLLAALELVGYDELTEDDEPDESGRFVELPDELALVPVELEDRAVELAPLLVVDIELAADDVVGNDVVTTDELLTERVILVLWDDVVLLMLGEDEPAVALALVLDVLDPAGDEVARLPRVLVVVEMMEPNCVLEPVLLDPVV